MEEHFKKHHSIFFDQEYKKLSSYRHRIQESFTLPPCHSSSFWFIFEGMEGAGKTTQARLLEHFLQERGYQVFLFREPGGTSLGEALRQLLLFHPRDLPWSKETELHLFLAARIQLMEEKILPLLLRPRHIVLLDRSLLSTLAYQGMAYELGCEKILEYHRFHPLCYLPHRYFLFTISSEESLERLHHRQKQQESSSSSSLPPSSSPSTSSPTLDRFERETPLFFYQLAKGYQFASRIFSDSVTSFPGMASIQQIHQDVRSQVETFLL
jgi:dTMP kinase